MLADLHIHTTASDGIYAPEEILQMALVAKISVISITDHDNTAGFITAKKYLEAQALPIKLLPGLEIDTYIEDRDVHILGYHIDPYYKPLSEALEWTRNGRIKRIEEMLLKLNALGYAISQEEVVAEAKLSQSIGRPHIARVMVKKDYFKTEKEVFDKLIARGKPGFCKQKKLSPQEVISLIQEAGGIAFLAHPSELRSISFAKKILKTYNFAGVEVWHPSAFYCKEVDIWLKLAKKLKLLTSGGSDFHGNKDRYPTKLGIFKVSYDNVKSVVKWKQKS